MKFSKGDIITPKEYYHGFENAEVLGVVESRGRQCYMLKIMNGTATIPITVEDNYKLKNEKKSNGKNIV